MSAVNWYLLAALPIGFLIGSQPAPFIWIALALWLVVGVLGCVRDIRSGAQP